MNAVQDGVTARVMQEGRSALLMQAVTDLLIRKGLIDAGCLAAVRREIDTRQPMLGARLAARAWTDERFRELLLTDAKQAVFDELGIRISQARVRRRREHPGPAPRHRLHALLVLPQGGSWAAAGVVQELRLSVAHGHRTQGHPAQVRYGDSGRHRDPCHG